jgi:hypothetical protein
MEAVAQTDQKPGASISQWDNTILMTRIPAGNWETVSNMVDLLATFSHHH